MENDCDRSFHVGRRFAVGFTCSSYHRISRLTPLLPRCLFAKRERERERARVVPVPCRRLKSLRRCAESVAPRSLVSPTLFCPFTGFPDCSVKMDNDAVSHNSTDARSGHMSEEEQDSRRKKIKAIMVDPHLSQQEKSRQIQSLMDGRRRSISSTGTHSIASGESQQNNYVNNMAQMAAQAAEYYSDEEGDAVMSDAGYAAPDDISYGYDGGDARSVASSVTHTSYQSNVDIPQGRYRQVHGRSYSLQDWSDQDRAAAAANTSIFAENPAQISRLMEQSRPNCEHYDRRCTIISPCCGLAFGCRICHDECPVLPKPLTFGKHHDEEMLVDKLEDLKRAKIDRRRSMPIDFEEEENHHCIDRFAIREVICRQCYLRQSSKTYVHEL